MSAREISTGRDNMSRYIIKINGVPSERTYNSMPFGRQMDYRGVIQDFKEKSKHIHFSAKHTTTSAAFKEFKRLYQPTQWFAVNHDAHLYHDDSFEVWFTV
jgi:hypothetical protein